MKVAGHKAAPYCLLPDVKSVGISFTSSLCETQKQAP